MLNYGIRKGALAAVQFRHFDHQRRRLAIFTKGGKIRELPIPDQHFWKDLERLILDEQAGPHHYLMHSPDRPIPVGKPDASGRRRTELRRWRDRPMGVATLHQWWYGCLANAGVVAAGTTAG